MSKKLTYMEVKDTIEKEKYTLISKVYRGCGIKLTIKCPNNHIYKCRLDSFKRGHRCRQCFGDKISKDRKTPFNIIKDKMEIDGYKLLSTTCKNKNEQLKMKCSNGHIFKIRPKHFINTYRRCPTCNKTSTREKECRDITIHH